MECSQTRPHSRRFLPESSKEAKLKLSCLLSLVNRHAKPCCNRLDRGTSRLQPRFGNGNRAVCPSDRGRVGSNSKRPVRPAKPPNRPHFRLWSRRGKGVNDSGRAYKRGSPGHLLDAQVTADAYQVPAVAKALGVDSGKRHVERHHAHSARPSMGLLAQRGRVIAAFAGDSRLMNREGQVVRRPDRQGADAAFRPNILDARSDAAKTARHRALGRSDNWRQEGRHALPGSDGRPDIGMEPPAR